MTTWAALWFGWATVCFGFLLYHAAKYVAFIGRRVDEVRDAKVGMAVATVTTAFCVTAGLLATVD